MSFKSCRSELLVIGYIHQYEKQHPISIPAELHGIVLMFYPRKYKLYGIGKTLYHQFGLKQEYEENNEEKYTSITTKTRWHYLSAMSSLYYNPNLISCGNRNIFIGNIQNEIYGVGCNLNGSVGIDSRQHIIENFTKIEFKDIDNMDNYTMDVMSTGAFTNHTFIVLKDIGDNNQIFYGFGSNSAQQQGYKSENNYFPTKIAILNSLFDGIRIIEIAAGYTHSLFLSSNGRVYSCGDNSFGQCGIKINDECGQYMNVTPQIVPFLYDIINISCGQFHNLCLDKNNRIWEFGVNSSNQLGLGQEYENKDQIDTAIINLYFKGNSDDDRIVFIDCGDNHSLCISINGKVYMFGANDCGQIGNGEIEQEDGVSVPFCIQSREICKDILFQSGSCGPSHTALISYYPHNNLYCFGGNTHAQTGNVDDDNDQTVPYLNSKKQIGVDSNDEIVKVLCDDDISVVICEI